MCAIVKLITIAVAVNSITLTCLDKTVLETIGCRPLDVPEPISQQTLCGKLRPKANSCCSQLEYDSQINYVLNIHSNRGYYQFQALKTTILEIFAQFERVAHRLIEEDTLAGAFDFKIRNVIKEARQLIPAHHEEIVRQIGQAEKSCLDLQRELATKVLCNLGVETASDHLEVDYEASGSSEKVKPTKSSYSSYIDRATSSDDTVQQGDLVGRTGYYLTALLTEEEATSIFESCYPMIKATCSVKHVRKVMNELKGETEQLDACSLDILLHEKNGRSVPSRVKSNIVESLFGLLTSESNILHDLKDIGRFFTAYPDYEDDSTNNIDNSDLKIVNGLDAELLSQATVITPPGFKNKLNAPFLEADEGLQIGQSRPGTTKQIFPRIYYAVDLFELVSVNSKASPAASIGHADILSVFVGLLFVAIQLVY